MGSKRPGREAGHSHTSSAEVKNVATTIPDISSWQCFINKVQEQFQRLL
jgi:hypothetical protein